MLQKTKDCLKKFKELWANEKGRSLIVLGFWLIFITIVIVFARSNSTSEVKTDVINFGSINSYSFTFVTNDSTFNGYVYDEKMIFYLDNQRYYVNQDVYLVSDNVLIKTDFDLGIMKITSNFLNNLLSGLNYTTHEYRRYVVSLDRFINLYDKDVPVDLTPAMNYNILVDVYIKGGVITKVVMDLSSYFEYNGIDEDYLITLYLYNVNEINDFSSDFEKLEVIE